MMSTDRNAMTGIFDDAIDDAVNNVLHCIDNDQRQLMDAMTFVGFLLENKSIYSGLHTDVVFFLNDRYQRVRFAGILGDELEVSDINGMPLRCGDILLMEFGDTTFHIPATDFVTEDFVATFHVGKDRDCWEVERNPDAWQGALAQCHIKAYSCAELYQQSKLRKELSLQEERQVISCPQP